MIGKCQGCLYWSPKQEFYDTDVVRHRFPTKVAADELHWCGEFKKDETEYRVRWEQSK